MKVGIVGWTICAALMLMPQGATAAEQGKPQSTERLLSYCKAASNSPEYFSCFFYIAGVGDMMISMAPDPHAGGSRMCGNPPVSAMVEAFVNFAEAHPEVLGGLQLAGVNLALNKAWPCAGDPANNQTSAPSH